MVEEDDDEKEEGEKRATKGKSQATCTRQQPPTSEELIINLLSPSPNAARSNSTTFASLSPAPLSRLPPSFAPLRPPPSLSLVLPFPFHPELPSERFPSSRFSSLLLRPRCAGLCVYDYDYSRSRFRRFPFEVSLSISPPSYRPPNLVATFAPPNAPRRDARNVAALKVEGLLSAGGNARLRKRGQRAVICGSIISSRDRVA